MKPSLIAFPIMLIGMSACCSPIDRMNALINESTDSINSNSAAIQSSTEVIRQNKVLIDQSTQTIQENRKHLESMGN